MKLPSKAKLAPLTSRDESRPILHAFYLRVQESDGEQRGYLEATDSYKLARIPVELDEGDTEGFVTREAIEAARKMKYDHVFCNGSLGVGNAIEPFVHFPRPELGTFPDTDKLLELEPATIDGARFVFGINPRLLLELAEGMACETVELEFSCTKTYKRGADPTSSPAPSPLRPLMVRPLGRKRGADIAGDTVGLIMPVRV